MNNRISIKEFERPPRGYGVVPFYWWMGDKLTKERIEWHIERMRGHSISGLQVNYAHSCHGGYSFGYTYKSDPELFSDEWWELFNWLMSRGKEEGFSVSLSDYTLGSPGQGYFTDEIIAEHPEMTGNKLKEFCFEVNDGIPEKLPDNILSLHLIDNGEMKRISADDISSLTSGKVCAVYSENNPLSLDPMYPGVGREVCAHFFDKFEEHAPGEGGDGLNFFFSDELNFGISGRLWNEFFADEFSRRLGYDVRDYLPCLFYEIGPFAKVRLDYYDTIVRLEEENYFSTVYNWHESRGMTYGCDHGGRGNNLTEFGDYFRTQKYNQGPGCDQPFLESKIVKNKVASSIAHLYNRKRTWLEGFHSSGWATSSGDFTDAVARNYVMGQNLLSAHGMYYSTHGGWWEWAPPCNTFHNPYWDDMAPTFNAIERMSFMLSEGVHRCSVAVLYPVMAAEGGIDADISKKTAFDSVISLYESGIDVDFIDFESILDADINNGRLEKAGESYRVIILPEMRTVRLGMMKKLDEFAREGGVVIGIGTPPTHCDAWDESELKNYLGKISFGAAQDDIIPLVRSYVPDDVVYPESCKKKYMMHRSIDGVGEVYSLYGGERGDEYGFGSRGCAVYLNPYDGKRYRLRTRVEGEYTYVRLPFGGSELGLISFGEDEELPFWFEPDGEGETIPLSDEWSFELVPCLDNRFGDYSLPVTERYIGAEVREICSVFSDSPVPFDFGGGEKRRLGFGPHYLKKDGFDTRGDYLDAIDKAVSGEPDGFEPYEVSMRFGRFDDPGEQGYHGLKKNVSDELLTMGKRKEVSVGTEYLENGRGTVFVTTVVCDEDCDAEILAGEIKPELLYIDGVRIDSIEEKLSLSRGAHSVVFAYPEPGRTYLMFAKGELRTQDYPLAMKWYRQENILPMDGLHKMTGGRYEWFYFDSAPALEEIELDSSLGTAVWINGEPAEESTTEHGTRIYRAKAVSRSSVPVAIRVESGGLLHGGAVFDGYIRERCGVGVIHSGDWGAVDGLSCYSGKADYSQEVIIPEGSENRRFVLEIDALSSSARVYVNGAEVGVKACAPWVFDLTGCLRPGANEIKVRVSNTLSNHYKSIPTRYRRDDESGVLGAARVKVY